MEGNTKERVKLVQALMADVKKLKKATNRVDLTNRKAACKEKIRRLRELQYENAEELESYVTAVHYRKLVKFLDDRRENAN